MQKTAEHTMTITTRLPESIGQRLSSLAKETGRAKSWYVRQALLEYLDDIEDVYYAEREYERVKTGKSKTYPLEDVVKELDLED